MALSLQIDRIITKPGWNSEKTEIIGNLIPVNSECSVYADQIPIVIEGSARYSTYFKGLISKIEATYIYNGQTLTFPINILSAQIINNECIVNWNFQFLPIDDQKDYIYNLTFSAVGQFSTQADKLTSHYINPRDYWQSYPYLYTEPVEVYPYGERYPYEFTIEQLPYSKEEYEISELQTADTIYSLESFTASTALKLSYFYKFQSVQESMTYPEYDPHIKPFAFVLQTDNLRKDNIYNVNRLEGVCFDVSDVFVSTAPLFELNVNFIAEANCIIGDDPLLGKQAFPIKLEKDELKGCLLEVKENTTQAFYAILSHSQFKYLYGEIDNKGIRQTNFGLEFITIPLCYTDTSNSSFNNMFRPMETLYREKVELDGTINTVEENNFPTFTSNCVATIYRTGTGIGNVVAEIYQNEYPYSSLIVGEGKIDVTDNVPLCTYKDQKSIKLISKTGTEISYFYPTQSHLFAGDNLVFRRDELKGMYLYATDKTFYKILNNGEAYRDSNSGTLEKGVINVTPRKSFTEYLSLKTRCIHRFNIVWDTNFIPDGNYILKVQVTDLLGNTTEVEQNIVIKNKFSEVEFSDTQKQFRDDVIDIMDLKKVSYINRDDWQNRFMVTRT